ncbi:3-keto sterol reductase [Hymenopellis radicata]|nr:3-keto sterol reductase [Hymenopellis radicata]
MSSRPIIIVTGANSGVGFGICERLLHQLSHATPADLEDLKIPTPAGGKDALPIPSHGVTLIMACRSVQRAEAAKKELFQSLDAYIQSRVHTEGVDEHAESFRLNVEIDVRAVDLADLSSVFRFTDEIKKNYPYISHLICNAGNASYDRISWTLLLKQMLTDPFSIVSRPAFNLHVTGERSVDGLGWMFQANLFSHYVMYRELVPLLKYTHGSRVMWTTSTNACAHGFSLDDWQLTETQQPYELVKFETEMFAAILDEAAVRDSDLIRHIIMHPGISQTGISAKLTGAVLRVLQVQLCYLVRILFISYQRCTDVYRRVSRAQKYHMVTPYLASVSAISATLIPLSAIPSLRSESGAYLPVVFESMINRWGYPRVEVNQSRFWPQYEKEARGLVERCQELYTKVQQDPHRSI